MPRPSESLSHEHATGSAGVARVSRRAVLAGGGAALGAAWLSPAWAAAGRQSRSGQPVLEQHDLFLRGQGGVDTYRIPALGVTNEGTILAVVDARRDDPSDVPGDIDVVLRRSVDGGSTWEEPRFITDIDNGAGDSSILVDGRTGRVFVFFVYAPAGVSFHNSQPGTNDSDDPDTLHAYVTHSDDDGRTWSEPRDLNPRIKEPSWAALFASSGHGIQTSTGRLVQPYVIRDGDDVIRAFNAYSDDGGETWQAGSLTEGVADENKAVELSDGRIMQNIRRNNAGMRYVALSEDGGATLGPLREEPALIDPGVNADIIRLAPDNTGPRSRWLLFSNPAHESQRVDLTVRLSRDDGGTWPVERLLHEGPSGYSAMAVLTDGTVGVLYERGEDTAFDMITFAKFHLGWLESE